MRALSYLAVPLGVLLALAVGNACNAIAGIEEPELKPALAETSAPPEDTLSCEPARWPAQPGGDDPSSTEHEFVVAIRSLGFGLVPGKPYGYDLDNTCTCPDIDTCKRPADAGPRCDEPGGRDLALNQEVLSVIQTAKGFSEADLNDGLERGRFGALVRVRKYNGTANDVQVEAALYLSSGWSGRFTGDAGPAWDGSDPWDLDPSTLADEITKAPKYVDTSAYVRDGVLVASRLEGARFALGYGTSVAQIVFTQGVITGKIVPRGGGFAIEDGVIAGRWPTSNVLSGIATLDDPFLGGPLCKSAITYNTVKKKVCTAADISSNLARDRGAAPCDAISMAFRFTAEPAAFGSVISAAPDAGEAGACVGFTDECP